MSANAFHEKAGRSQVSLVGFFEDAPKPRAIQYRGEIAAIPRVGGLHHHYERRIA